jgi:phage terminase large subunit
LTRIVFEVRRQLIPLVQPPSRFIVGVCHRRAGKTVASIQRLLNAAVTSKHKYPRVAYVAPFLKQAKDIAWDYLKRMSEPLGGEPHESELRVDLPNGARVRLYGADNPESLRGGYLNDVVLDEFADMDPRVWTTIILPMLADYHGTAAFIGTPKGHNRFWELFRDAEDDPDWSRLMLRASETGLVQAAEIALQRRSMTPDEFAQEYECSFSAAIRGAYYAQAMEQADKDGRITRVPYDPAHPVGTAWDLGYGDSTSIWVYQKAGRELRLIDYYEGSGVGLDHYVAWLQERRYDKVHDPALLPHDAAVGELGTGKTRKDVLEKLGVKSIIVPKLSVDDGINAVRMLLPRCVWDAKRCERGIEALRHYRTEWDDKRQALRNAPLHDWTSHPSDAFRYLAVGLRDKPLGKSDNGIKYKRMASVA